MKTIYGLMLFVVLGGCVDKYSAPVHIPASGYLVVEGFINAGNGATLFSLSRATGLDSPYLLTEPGARVSVESSNGDSYPLTELGNGKYSIDQVPVNVSLQYKVHIQTADGKEYESDLSSPKITPPIDSVNWKPVMDGVEIYVTTHDPTGNSRYYQWRYEETWEYTSAYISYLEYQDSGVFVQRPDSDQVHICYIGDSSATITIGSSAQLNEDMMYEYPLTLVPYATTNKLEIEYSILVKQYTLSQEEYEWDQKVKKNTEQLGSIFDAQPSDISGNIHCISNPAEPVIGFVGCSSETVMRIFINRSAVPQTPVYTGYEDCVRDTVANQEPQVGIYFGSGAHLPILGLYAPGNIITPYAYLGAGKYCVDCRVMGGVLTKPAFWP